MMASSRKASLSTSKVFCSSHKSSRFCPLAWSVFFLFFKPIFLNSLLRPDSVIGRSSFSINSGMVMSGVFSISVLIWVIWVLFIFGFSAAVFVVCL
jgi:hypothetical protein